MASIEKRGETYRITACAGYDITGKQIKHRMTWKPESGMTARQIKKELERQAVLFEDKVQSGEITNGNIKLIDFIELWFKDYGERQLRPLTLQRYRQLLGRLNPAMGHMRIDRIKPHTLIEFYKALDYAEIETVRKYTAKGDIKALLSARCVTYQKLSDVSGVSLRTVKDVTAGKSVSGRTADAIAEALSLSKAKLFTPTEEETPKLSGKTKKHYHAFLSSVFERAVKWGYLDSNPCHKVDAPKTDKTETRCFTVEEAAYFLDKLNGEPLEYQTMFNILLLTGMRRGELMGLEWADVDLEENKITIRRTSQYTAEKGVYTDTTKTEKSKRIITIPAELAELLRRHRINQMKQRFALGDKWIETDRLFTQWNGAPMHPNTPYSYFQKLLKKYGLPRVTLHSLRHTNATIMICSGTDIRTVAGRLGHSQTSTTLNIYAHLLQSSDKAAADVVTNALLSSQPIRANA